MNAPQDHVADYLPNSIEAEQALLGAVLMVNDTYLGVADIVRPDMFFEPLHQQIFGMIAERIEAGGRVTPLTLSAVLGKDSQSLISGDLTISKYLARLAAEGVASTIPAADYAKTIRDLWTRRQIISLSRDLMQRAAGSFQDIGVDALLDDADTELCSIRFGKSIDGVATIQEALTASLDQTAKAYQGGNALGLTTGIASLDEMIGPMMPGDLITLLGASGHGKSALAAQVLAHNAKPSLDANAGNKPGLFFSMEMANTQLARRAIAAECGITSRAQRAGEILPAEFELLTDVARRLGPLPLYFDETSGQTVSKIVRKARALKKRYKIEMIVIDHLLEIRPENSRWSKVDTVENAVRELKRLAKELQVTIFLLAQATREGQKREHWRLRSNDVYGGDVVKQSSDMLLSLGIPSVWLGEREPDPSDQKDHDRWAKQTNDWVGKAEIGAPKVRDGESGNWRQINFDGKRTLFSDR